MNRPYTIYDTDKNDFNSAQKFCLDFLCDCVRISATESLQKSATAMHFLKMYSSVY